MNKHRLEIMDQEKELPEENLPYHAELENPDRRDFVIMSSTAAICAGAAVVAVPFVSSLAPDKGVLAVGSTEVNLAAIKPGETHTVMWRGGPVFVRNRTAKEIQIEQVVDIQTLRDPQLDSERVKQGKEQWLVVRGVCTHLGCVPLADKGEFGGWMCPCHGSHYDVSGRIRKGPAPLNLEVPPYEFINDTMIKIG